jgi:hypothetical protein
MKLAVRVPLVIAATICIGAVPVFTYAVTHFPIESVVCIAPGTLAIVSTVIAATRLHHERIRAKGTFGESVATAFLIWSLLAAMLVVYILTSAVTVDGLSSIIVTIIFTIPCLYSADAVVNL